MNQVKALFKKVLLLPFISKVWKVWYVQSRKGEIFYEGDYKNWKQAQDKSLGYSNEIILQAVRHAMLQVKEGKAVYERDSVLFDEIQYSWPLLSCLMKVALANKGHLHLIDFGGSLGSTYYQNRNFLKEVYSLKWHIVEQKHFVESGKENFENEQLEFFYTIEEASQKETIYCMLLSGVLQCLPDPYRWLQIFLDKGFPYIIIDRTAFIAYEKERITIENVSENVYKASYPSWFFNEKKFLKVFEEKYELLAGFDSYADSVMIADDGKKFYWKGFFLKLKDKL